MKEFKGVQKDILLANKKNQLVSAGAGSGKTTVMIEKITDLLLNKNVDVDNILVVTFTVLAAQEMKERLIKNLKNQLLIVENEQKLKVLEIIEKISTASIDTIDGFSSKTIKKYFYELEISPNIEIISDATKDYYMTKAMNKAINDFSKRGDELNLMLDLFGGNARNLDTLKDLLLTCYYNVINMEDCDEFLFQVCNEYQDGLKSESVVNEYLCSLVETVRKKIIGEYAIFSDSVKTKLDMFISSLQQFNSKMSFKFNLKVLNSLQPIRFGINEYKQNENLKLLTSKISSIFEFRSDLEKNQIDENYEEKNEKIEKYLLIFINLLKNFIKNYAALKSSNNLIDFNDLNRLVIKLLNNDFVRKELQEKYKYIFIDEYQDVNPLQDKLMNLLTGGDTTVFMVGDVKQSIYGFRGSSPEWFLSKYNEMKKNKEMEDVFDMNINFRSSPTILQFINEIFFKLMTKETADIDYKNDCEIDPKRDDIVDEKVKIYLVKEQKSDELESGIYSVQNHKQNDVINSKHKEALLVLKIITELIGTEFYDANLKQIRKLTYSDIAILTHSDKDESSCILAELLKNNNVPLNRNNKMNVADSEVVKLILSILKCVSNTADDVDYLATFLSLTDLTIDDVAEIRDKNFTFYENLIINQQNLIENSIFLKIKCGFEILERIRNASLSKTNRELINYILDNEKLRYSILRKPNGERELKCLEEFLNKLSTVEDSLGIAEFIDIVESNVSSSGDFVSVDNENSVTIQTIHKSKGLEYPVVILFNSSKIFSHLTEKESINFNSDIGLGFDYFDIVNRIKMDSLTKFAIGLANAKKGYKEELRLLYVALTRAKNKLFITGTYKNMNLDDIKKTSYTNMLLDCFADRINGDKLETDTAELEFFGDVEFLNGNLEDEKQHFELVGKDFEYVNKNKFTIPLKNTVTGINSKLCETDSYKVKSVFKTPTQYEVEDRALMGVEYHLALEKLDLQADYEQNTNYKTVDYKKIKLAHSKLSTLVKDAISIKKEAEFMMYVPYNEIIAGEIEDKVLVQGVVDLIIEKEKSVIIVDYKFSKLPVSVLKKKYAEQLNLYKKAVEEAFGKPVENTFIYSIETGELF